MKFESSIENASQYLTFNPQKYLQTNKNYLHFIVK